MRALVSSMSLSLLPSLASCIQNVSKVEIERLNDLSPEDMEGKRLLLAIDEGITVLEG